MKTAALFAGLILLTGSAGAGMYDPFIKTAPKPAESGLRPPPPMLSAPVPEPLMVSAIMNDKAFINGHWYRIGDRVEGMEIVYIRNDFVGFRDGTHLKMLSVGSNRRILGIKESE
ncbi:MAG: hypothetical protein AB7S65_12945 [Sulfuricurvum sp.]